MKRKEELVAGTATNNDDNAMCRRFVRRHTADVCVVFGISFLSKWLYFDVVTNDENKGNLFLLLLVLQRHRQL